MKKLPSRRLVLLAIAIVLAGIGCQDSKVPSAPARPAKSTQAKIDVRCKNIPMPWAEACIAKMQAHDEFMAAVDREMGAYLAFEKQAQDKLGQSDPDAHKAVANGESIDKYHSPAAREYARTTQAKNLAYRAEVNKAWNTYQQKRDSAERIAQAAADAASTWHQGGAF